MKRRLLSTSIPLLMVLLLALGCVPAAPAPPATGPAAPAASPVAAAATPGAGSPTTGGTLVMGFRSAITNVDGTKNGHGMLNGLLHHVVETLVKKDQSGQIVPHLATDWEISPDNLTWTFHLRQGVTFHDGAEFNAEAVKKSFERVLSTEFNLDRRRFYTPIQEITVVDPYTISFTTAEPWGPFLTYLTYIAAAIVSPNLADQRDFDLAIGTGPFRMRSWNPGQETILDRNEDYWGEKPYLDSIVFREIPEDSARLAMLQTGEIDADIEAAAQFLPQMEGNPDFVVVSEPSERGLSIDFNTAREPFDDVRVRQAVKHAIDVDAIVTGVMFGQASPLSAFPGCAAGVTGCYEIPDYHSYDPERARQLLTEAGYPDGFTATLVYGAPRYPRHTEILTAIQGQLQEVGINIEFLTLEWATYVQETGKALDETRIDLTSWAWSSTVGDVAFGMESRLQAASIPPTGSTNVMFYDNPEVENLLAQAARSTDEAERNDLLRQAQIIVGEDIPILYLLRYNITAIHAANVHGIQFNPNEEHWYAYAWKE